MRQRLVLNGSRKNGLGVTVSMRALKVSWSLEHGLSDNPSSQLLVGLTLRTFRANQWWSPWHRHQNGSLAVSLACRRRCPTATRRATSIVAAAGACFSRQHCRITQLHYRNGEQNSRATRVCRPSRPGPLISAANFFATHRAQFFRRCGTKEKGPG